MGDDGIQGTLLPPAFDLDDVTEQICIDVAGREYSDGGRCSDSDRRWPTFEALDRHFVEVRGSDISHAIVVQPAENHLLRRRFGLRQGHGVTGHITVPGNPLLGTSLHEPSHGLGDAEAAPLAVLMRERRQAFRR